MLIQNLCASEHKHTFFFSVLGLGLVVVCLSEFLGINFTGSDRMRQMTPW